MAIRFYRTNDRYGEFSNFSQYGFTIEGKFWPTSEHYFQAKKFIEPDMQEEVRKAKTPMEAAKMGRDRSRPLRTDWESVKDEIMKTAVLQKFSANKELARLLVSTGEEKLVEETFDDFYWGCGKNGTGKNRLGEILMEVRSILKQKME